METRASHRGESTQHKPAFIWKPFEETWSGRMHQKVRDLNTRTWIAE